MAVAAQDGGDGGGARQRGQGRRLMAWGEQAEGDIECDKIGFLP